MFDKEHTKRFNPKEAQIVEETIRGSYDDFVRLERRNLLLISSISIITCISNIDPSSATLFGFRFDNLSSEVFFCVILSLTVYFQMAYLVYGWSSYKQAKAEWKSVLMGSGTITGNVNAILNFFSINTSAFRYHLWVALHYYLPIIMGCTGVVCALYEIA